MVLQSIHGEREARSSGLRDAEPRLRAGPRAKILDDPEKGEEARKLFADAQRLLDRVVAEKWLKARAVFGLFPASAPPNDSLEVYTDESLRGGERPLQRDHGQGARR